MNSAVSNIRMEKNTNSLVKDIQILLESLKTHKVLVPAFKNIKITINQGKTTHSDGCCYQLVKKNEIYDILSFEKQYKDLKSKGYSWINLHCAGILDGDLLFTLELPYESSKVPFGFTSINFSGPALDPNTNEPNWDVHKTFKFVTD